MCSVKFCKLREACNNYLVLISKKKSGYFSCPVVSAFSFHLAGLPEGLLLLQTILGMVIHYDNIVLYEIKCCNSVVSYIYVIICAWKVITV